MCLDDWDDIEKQLERSDPVARRLSQSDHLRAYLFQLHMYERTHALILTDAHAHAHAHARQAKVRFKSESRL